tara:strand:+ start:51 stop:611 length:561 start_codon:yes stop_codon:yes gene_type:complete
MIEVTKKGLKVDAKGNLVVVEKQTQPTKATKNKVAKIKLVREIYGIKLSTKLPKEVKAVIQVIENNKGKGFISFDILFSQYCKELSKVSNSKSNLKTRFRRILYRTVEGVILKKSIQSAKFNLKANIKGIKVQSQLNIEYKTNGDAITNSVDTNFFKFVVAEKVETRKNIVATKSDIARATKLSIS